MAQGRVRLQTIIVWLALVTHWGLAAALLVQCLASASSDAPTTIIFALVIGVVILPIVPSVRRVLAAKSIAAAVKPSRSQVQEAVVVALAVFGLPLLLFGWPDLVEPAWYQAGEDQKADQLTGICLIWLANVVRELTS
jgi:hypothetical protein